MAASKKKPLTATDLERADRLKKIWSEAERRGRATQKDLAIQWGKSVGLISQYINGHTALNLEAQLRFARYLHVWPTDIWPDFEYADFVARPEESLSQLDPADRAAVRSLIASLQRKRA